MFSHIYSFKTVGRFFVENLSKKYKIILIVDKDASTQDQFYEISKDLDILSIEFIDSRIIKYITTYNQFKKILKVWNPCKIFVNNHIYPRNFYLAYLAKNFDSSTQIIVYSNGLNLNSQKSLENTSRKALAKNYAKKFFIPKTLILLLLSFRSVIYKLIVYLILPTFITKKLLFSINIFNNLDSKVANLYDYFLTYSDFEKEELNLSIDCLDKIKVIDSPWSGFFNNFKTEPEAETELPKDLSKILLLPSFLGFYEQDESKTFKKWLQLAEEINNEFPSSSVSLKLHPLVYDLKYTKKIELGFKQFNTMLINPQTTLDSLIHINDTFITDVSTSAWWISNADLNFKKTIISYQPIKFPGYDQLNFLPNLVVLKEPNQIKNYKTYKRNITHQKQNNPSLNDFMLLLDL